MGDPRGSVENAPLQGFEANLHNLGRGSVSFSSPLLSFLLEQKTRIERKRNRDSRFPDDFESGKEKETR